jgi:hypothetical protein
MLKNNYVIKTLLLIGAILYNSAIAQELEIPTAHYPNLPEYAATAEGFVPPGWTLEDKKSGDLNGDGRPDLLLVLHENNPKNIIEHDGFGTSPIDTNPRILAVAFAKPGGGYALAMQNHTLIDRHIDPSLSDVLENGAVSIVHGNLRVEIGLFANAGSWWMGNTSYTFRYRQGGFKLIGYDKFFIHRSSHEIDAVSINYLTGRIKITTNEGGRENEGKDKVQWKKLSSLKPIPIAAIDGDTFAPEY